jgi:hypothetical protein
MGARPPRSQGWGVSMKLVGGSWIARCRRLVIAASVVVLPMTGNAFAGVGYELYPGPRPKQADAVMSKLTRELALLGDQFGVEARKQLGYVKLPAIVDSTVTPASIAEDFKLGQKALIQGTLEAAARMLDAASRDAADNGPMALQVGNLDELRFDGLVALALLRKAQADEPGARLVMADAYRTYPDRPATPRSRTSTSRGSSCREL